MQRFALLLPALFLALPAYSQAPELPPSLQIVQWIGNDTWNWDLTRHGTTNVYDAVGVSSQSGNKSQHTFELRSFDGKTVVFNRPDAGIYTGTLAPDGRAIFGKTNFGGANEGWRAMFGSAVIFPSPQDRPSSRAAREAYETGVSLRNAGRAKDAVSALDRAIKADPNFVDSWRQRALALSTLARHKDALSDYDRALQLEPGNARALNGRATTKNNLGDTAGAMADARRAVELDPTYANAYSTRGAALYAMKDYAGALADFERAAKYDPAGFFYIYNSGLARACLGDNAGAQSDLSRYLQLDPNSAYAKNARERLAQIKDAAPQVAAAVPPAPAVPTQPAAPVAQPAAAPAAAAANSRVLTIPTALFQKDKWNQADTTWQPLPPGALPDPGPVPRAAIPELLDINHLTPANYNATITAAKEAMRLLMGPISAADEKRFDTKWAPLFEYPCQPVIEYFNRLNPLLNRFLTTRAALHEAMYRFNLAWEEATTAAGLTDEDGVREAMQVCKIHRDNIVADNALLSDIGRQIQALGEPPDPLAHKARARALHEEALKAIAAPARVPSTSAPGGYWVLSNLAVEQKPQSNGEHNRYTFSTAEGFASGVLNFSEADPITKKVFRETKGGSVKWSRLPRVVPEATDGGAHIPYSLDMQCTQFEMTPNPIDPFIGMPCAYFSYADDFGGSGLQANIDKPPVKLDGHKIMLRPTPEKSVTFTIKVGTMGGYASYTYTYVARKLSSDQVAEIKAKAAEEETRNAAVQQQAAAQQAAAQEDAEAKMWAISLAQANQAYFQSQLDKLRTERAANPGQADRFDYLIMVTEANLQAERDSERTTVTGEWTRTRTAYDDWNVAYMASQSQQTVGVTTHALKAEAAVPRLIGLLPKELRYTETQNTQAAISQAIERGDFAAVAKIVNDLSARVHGQAEKDSELYTRAANAANYVVGATEALRYGADKAMFVLSFAPGGGAVYPWYMGATGYFDGGPAHGVREVLTNIHPVTMTLVSSYDGYERGGVKGAVVEGAKTAITALAFQKAVGVVAGRYYSGGKGNPEAISVERQLADAQYQSKFANGRAKVALFKNRSEELAGAMRSNADPQTIAALRLKAEEAAKAVKCDYAAKTILNQNARSGDTATMNRYLTHERKFMDEVREKFQQNQAADGWAPQKIRQFSNSASKGKAGMDVDIGIVEPPRFLGTGSATRSNPEWHEWNKTIQQRGERRSLLQYQEAAQKHLDDAFDNVVGGPGRSSKEAYVNFTSSTHKESYSDLAWLGKKDIPHADFDFINPTLAQQAADVTSYKIMHNPNAPAPAKLDPNRLKLTKDPIPDYLFFQEQCRTLVKDMNTKLIGSSGAVLPSAPLAKTSKAVQQHMLSLRAVMDDFAGGRIGPIEADRKLKEMTGGEGLPYVLKKFEAALVGGTR